MDLPRAAPERDCEAAAPRDGHFDPSVIDKITARVQAVTGRPFVIAIDGPGGSGKSTLARQVEAAYEGAAAVVEGDDFYADLDDDVRLSLDATGGYERYFDWQRLRDAVFIPAREGLALRYQRYDWGTARMGDWRTVDPVGLLIVEGVYVSRPELRDFPDLSLWVSTSEQQRFRRQTERRENDDEWIRRWMAAERYYIEDVHQPDSGEVRIDGG